SLQRLTHVPLHLRPQTRNRRQGHRHRLLTRSPRLLRSALAPLFHRRRLNTIAPTHAPHPHQHPPPADCLIIGAGVIGLTTAILCREAGINAHIIAAHTSPRITSERAAAFFHPYGFAASSQLYQWCADSYQRFTQLEATTPKAGIAFINLREFHRSHPHENTTPWWAGLVRDFRSNSSPPPPFAIEYRATMPTIDMRCYLPWLMHRYRDQLERSEEHTSELQSRENLVC